MTVSVLGSGAFGTALAAAIARKHDITLWSRDTDQVRDMRLNRRNEARLPGIELPATLAPTGDIAEALDNDVILVCVPMQQLRRLLEDHAAELANKTLIACCKGIELDTGLGPVRVIENVVPGAAPALLTGPSFATEIARGLPTALTLACADPALGAALQSLLSTDAIRLYRVSDTIGAELGGALKNVIAIACGAVIGAGLGNSARAALMTRGYAEMLRLVLALGGQAETLAGLSGFGDLVLTCGSEQSRNYRLGLSIGRSETFDPMITVEGAATARAVSALADERGIDMPITQAVARLVAQEQTLEAAITSLLARSLKDE
jgi:glycerol-3-phosphate dehydrogenase (NAD(P)+)